MHIEDEYIIRVKVRQNVNTLGDPHSKKGVPTITVQCPDLDPSQARDPQYLLQDTNLLPQIRFIPPSNSAVLSADASKVVQETCGNSDTIRATEGPSRLSFDRGAFGYGSLYVPRVLPHCMRPRLSRCASEDRSKDTSTNESRMRSNSLSPRGRLPDGPNGGSVGRWRSTFKKGKWDSTNCGGFPSFSTNRGERVRDIHCTGPPRGVKTNLKSHEPPCDEDRDPSMLMSSDPSELVSKHFSLSNNFNASTMKDIRDSSVPNPAGKYVVSGDLYDGDEAFYDPVNPYTNGTDGSFCDPGYVSERSDEDDPTGAAEDTVQEGWENTQNCPFPEPPDGTEPTLDYIMKVCPFVNADTVFEVTVMKNSRGLGLSLTGGIECDVNLAGLIRIRKVYPQTPAHLCGRLQPDDLILEANRNILTGLTSHEALEVLRTTGNEVNLLVCRPTKEPLANSNYAPTYDTTDSLAVPGSSHTGQFLSPSPSFSTCGEMELHLSKVNGSLGFTLRKQDNSILGHTIKSLVKEPAISDGRIRPGDKLLSVNGTDMCGLTHEQAVKFLRTCPQTVVLRLYRDAMQTPISPASPTEFEFMPRPKQLRKEARDMLSDLASRKQSGSLLSNENADTPGTTRRRRVQKTPSPDLKNNESNWESLVRDATFSDDSPSPSHDVPYCPLPDEQRPNRPSFLDLNCHRSCSRKSNFTPPHEEPPLSPHASGLTPDMASLDATVPPSSAHSDLPTFSYANPNYHSLNIGAFSSTVATSDNDLKNSSSSGDNKGLRKWKGIVFPAEEECTSRQQHLESLESKTVTIELCRGWNSRLGFSLQQKDSQTVIANIYDDSVAARDGRLKIGDQILSVNGESVTDWATDRTIDFLRKTTGKIVLVVKQKYF